MPMICKNPNGIFWSSHLLWIIRCQEANSPLRDAAIPPSHRAKVKILATENGLNMGWSWPTSSIIKYYLYLLRSAKKTNSKRCGPVAETKLCHASCLGTTQSMLQEGSQYFAWHTSQMSSTSRVKLETQAASFANDTIEIHRISSYTTLPVSKN